MVNTLLISNKLFVKCWASRLHYKLEPVLKPMLIVSGGLCTVGSTQHTNRVAHLLYETARSLFLAALYQFELV